MGKSYILMQRRANGEEQHIQKITALLWVFWWRLSQSSTGSWKFRCAFLLLRAPPAGKLSLKSRRHSVARVNVSVTRVLHLGCCECRHCRPTLAIDGSGWTREAGESSGEDETAVAGTKTKMGTKCCSWMMQEKKRKGEQVGNSNMELFGTKYDLVPKIAVALLLNLFEFK